MYEAESRQSWDEIPEWLEGLETWLTQQGNFYRKKYFNDVNHIPIHPYGVYSITEKAWKKKHNSRILATPGNQSPPPPIQWNKRSDILTPPRPRASLLREAFNKLQKQAEASTETSIDKMQRPLNKGDQKKRGRSTTRRGGDAGERPLCSSASIRPRSSATTQTITRTKRSNNDSLTSKKDVFLTSTSIYARNLNPSRAIHTSPSPVKMSLTDNKKSSTKGKETRANASRYERLNHLCHALTMTPQNAHRVTPKVNDNKTAAMYSTAASRGSTEPTSRRRLGRSPSPSPPPSAARMPQHARVANTRNTLSTSYTNASKRPFSKDSSKTSLKTALSKLKMSTGASGPGRPVGNGSIGAHSLGAASLGARRTAPAPVVQRSPRVRSDERNVATQGDVLNSIKVQRRLRKKNSFEDNFKKK